MALSVPLRITLAVGLVFVLLGLAVLPVPASLWATLLGCVIVLVTIVTGLVRTAAQRRRR